MKHITVLLAVAFVVALIAYVNRGEGLAAANQERFSGHITLFHEDAPVGTYVLATVGGQTCGESVVALADLDNDTNLEPSYDMTVGGSENACTASDAEIEFHWYQNDGAISTTCTPIGTFAEGADVRLDLVCGVYDTFSAIWMVENTTDQMQRSVEVFPQSALGTVSVIDAPGRCGQPSLYTTFFLSHHAELVWPEACVAPGEIVRLRLSTDCPCHSELEVQRVVWLAGEPIFKATVDCDGDVDGADALRDLLIPFDQQSSGAPACPSVYPQDPVPNALSGIWGDIECDKHVTALDALTVLRVALQLPSGLSDDCLAQYYGSPPAS